MDTAGSKLWFFSIDTWGTVSAVALVLAVVFGILAAVTSFASSFIGGEVSNRREAIGAKQRAASNKAIAAANEAAAIANERAASLEKDAAQLRLDLEVEKQAQAPRVLTRRQADVIRALKGKLSEVTLVSAPSPEARIFTMAITFALSEAGVVVHPMPDQWRGSGIQINLVKMVPAAADDPLISAFTKAGLNPSYGSFEHSSIPGARTDIPFIYIGDKFPHYSSFPMAAFVGPKKKP